MDDPIRLEARDAFDGLPLPSGLALRVEARTGLQMAAVVMRGRHAHSLAEKARALGIALLGTGPGKWLAVAEPDAAPLAERLSREFGGLGAVTDLSDAYAVLRVAGASAHALFEKGLGVDLHPRAFKPGDVAATTCGHINVVIWQLDATPTYEVALYRSYAASFHHWLTESVAELAA